MEHVVFFPAADGTPAFRRLATLDDAARFVEHLRNVENVSEASVHTLTEVPVSFKAWYRVELPQGAAEAPATVELPSHLEIPAPTTIAEAIETYTHEGSDEVGSATGIVVPEREFVPQEEFAFAQSAQSVGSVASVGSAASIASAASVASAQPVPLVADQRAYGQPAPESQRDAQVLEPVFGARRDRGIGYFAR